MQHKGYITWLFCMLAWAGIMPMQADNRPYLCEIGVQGGIGYYAGDATEHIFNHVREAFGGHFRYKFDPRWSLQVKGLYHRITGPVIVDGRTSAADSRTMRELLKQHPDGKWVTKMVNMDVMAEFNFFRMGLESYDRRVKPYSPYIFLGIGTAFYGDKYKTVACYLPLGIGFKWQFAPQWGLNLAWQHNIYFADDLEQVKGLGNTYDLNGSNIMNFDVTGQLTFGIVFAFAKPKKVCRHCDL